jgi:hypothetical protein
MLKRLEKLAKLGRNLIGAGLLALASTGCEWDEDDDYDYTPTTITNTSSSTKPSNSSSSSNYKPPKKPEDNSIVPGASETDAFAIVHPQDGEIIQNGARTTIKGVGLDKERLANFKVYVYTDGPYLQGGMGSLNWSKNHSWSMGVNLGGTGFYRTNHTIKATATYLDGTTAEAKVERVGRTY